LSTPIKTSQRLWSGLALDINGLHLSVSPRSGCPPDRTPDGLTQTARRFPSSALRRTLVNTSFQHNLFPAPAVPRLTRLGIGSSKCARGLSLQSCKQREFVAWRTRERPHCRLCTTHLSPLPHAACAGSKLAMGAIHFQPGSVLSP
jgi:hypothetical protein